METGLCCHFKFGFCRFGDLCHRRHIKEICGNKVCPDVNVCPLRHPKICSFFTKYGNCKFGLYCSYGHEKSAMQTKIENLESELQNLTSEIKDLKGQIKLIQQQLQDTTSATHLPPPSPPVPVPPHSSLSSPSTSLPPPQTPMTTTPTTRSPSPLLRPKFTEFTTPGEEASDDGYGEDSFVSFNSIDEMMNHNATTSPFYGWPSPSPRPNPPPPNSKKKKKKNRKLL